MNIADADLDFMLADTGAAVKYGTQRGYGLLDVAQDRGIDQHNQPVAFERRTLILRTGAFNGLAVDTTIRIDGADYQIHQISPVTDGRELHLLVAPV
jgi:hypothetical protein